jgi:hypothetical protein
MKNATLTRKDFLKIGGTAVAGTYALDECCADIMPTVL